MAFTDSNEKILLGILEELKKNCDEIQDETLKTKILSRLGDSLQIVHDNIEREQGMAVLYLMRTKDIQTNITNPFKDKTSDDS